MPNIGQEITEVIARLSINSLKNIIGNDIVETLRLISEKAVFPDSLRKVANDCFLQHPEQIFSDKATRNLIYQALTKESIDALSKRLNLANSDALLALDPSQNPEILSRYLGYFGIDTRPSTISVIDPDYETVSTDYGLFTHQRRAADNVRDIIGDGYGRVILHMPTGAGKTRTAMHIVSQYLTAVPFIHEVYPAASKKFQHSSGAKRSQISPIASMS